MTNKPALTEGCWDNVLVSNVDGADDFTVKLAGSENEFVQMMIELQSECRKTTPLIKHTIGDIIMARYVDEQWYRARITALNSDGSLTVQYIDYGNSSNVSKQDTRPSSHKSLSMPEQGVRCRLNRIDFSKLTKLTFDQANRSFKQAAENQQVVAQFVTQVSDRWNIELIHPMGSINQWYGTEYSCLLSGATPSRPTTLPHPNNPGLKSLSNKQSMMSGSTTTNGLMESFGAQVVYSNSPIEFWFQKDSDQADINALCEVMASSQANPSYTPTVGCVCAALYSEDETWYRAQVLDLPPPNNATVYFVDYGNTETIDRSRLAQLPPGTESQPHYAYIASLTGIQPFAGAWPKGASDRFADIAMADVCTVGVLRTDGKKLTVKLTVTGQDVAQMLIAEGLAGPSTPAPVEMTDHPLDISPHRNTPDGITLTPTRSTNHPSPSITTYRYPVMPAEPNKLEKVYVSWLIDPDQFWVQKEGCENILEQLLADALRCSHTATPLLTICAGCTCIAKYAADGQWYRGEIQEVKSGTCTILFVDYGNTEEIDNSDICAPSPELLDIPAQSVKCSLIGIKPVSGEGWSTEAHDIMESLLGEGGICCFLAKNKDCYLVDITHGDDDKSLSESLISSNVALSNKTSSQASGGSHGSRGSRGAIPKSGAHKSTPLPNSRDVTATSSSEPTSYGDQQYVSTTKTPASDGGPQGDVAAVPAAKKSTLPPPKIPDCTHVDLGLSVGSKFTATVVHVESLKHFYVLCDKTRVAMDDMYEIMNRFYHSGTLTIVSSPQIGGIYVVQFSEDQQWYRCKIVKNLEGGKVEVFYIDYGNSEVTDPSNLRVINPEYVCLPAQALLCDLSQSPDTVSSTDIEDFKQKVLLQDIQAEVVGMIDGKVDLNLIKDGQPMGAQYKPHYVKTYTDDDTPTENFNAFLVFEESQTEFYVQKSEDSDLLETTMSEVTSLSETGAMITGPISGQACIAKFADDGAWYRAEVISVSGGCCKVHFVDYGNSATVALTDLRDIDDKLKQTPKLAVLCSLPTTNNDSLMEFANNGESELTVTVLKVETVNNKKKLIVSICNNQGQEFGSVAGVTSLPVQSDATIQSTPAVFIPSNLGSLGSQIVGYLVYEEDDKFYIQRTEDTEVIGTVSEQVQTFAAENQGDLLKNPEVGGACIAKFSDDGLWYRAEICSVDLPVDSSLVHFVDYGNTATVSTGEMLNINAQLTSVNRLAIQCKFSSKTDFAPGEEEVSLKVVSLEENVVLVSLSETTDVTTNETVNEVEQEVEKAACVLQQPEMLALGSQIVGFLVYEEGDKFYIQKTEDTEVVGTTSEQVQTFAAENQDDRLKNPEVGGACIAKFSDDGLWYRAEICSVDLLAGSCEVHFVDYGNNATVSIDEMLNIHAQLANIKRLAIPCKLTSKSEITVTEFSADQELTGTVIDSDKHISILTLSNQSGDLLPTPQTKEVVHEISTAEDTIIEPARFVTLNLDGVGSQIVGYLVYEESGKFYIQRTKDTEIIEQTSEQVQTFAAEKADDLLNNPVVGGACIAKYSDDSLWYRAEICSVDLPAGSCRVYFVDYGNTATVSTDEMLNINAHLANATKLAYPCQMCENTDVNLTVFAGDSELVASIVSVQSETLLIETLTNAAKNETIECKKQSLKTAEDSMSKLSINTNISSGSTTPLRPPDFIFPKKLVLTETVLKGFLSHVESADQLYIQLEQDRELLTKITVEVQVAGKSSEPAVYCPVDQACMAVFSSDHSWYRSRVTSVMEGDNRSTIQFVDFGNSETVRNSQLKVLPVSLRSAAPVAIRCQAINDEIKSLTCEEINEKYFGNPLNVTFTGTAEPYNVDIMISGEETESSGEAAEPEAVEPEAMPVEPQPTDVVEDSEPQSLVISETDVSLLSYPLLSDLEEGSDVAVVVTHIETPDKFYCQLVEHSKDMDEVAELLYQNYLENDGYKSLLLESQYTSLKGQYCVARFSDDEQFYRAITTESTSSEDVRVPVQFIDFGNGESVSHDVLCIPHSALLKYSCQAVQFSLHNTYSNHGETWEADSISHLNKLVSVDNVRAKILKVVEADRNKTCVVSLNTPDGNVSDNLADGGFSYLLPKSAVSNEEFCNDILSSVQEKLQEKFGSASVLTELTNLIRSLNESLNKQLASMTETVGRSSTAQDFVRFVLINMMNEITEVESESSNHLVVTNKNQMQIEVNNVVGVLLEKVIESNDKIATQLANQHEDEPNESSGPDQDD